MIQVAELSIVFLAAPGQPLSVELRSQVRGKVAQHHDRVETKRGDERAAGNVLKQLHPTLRVAVHDALQAGLAIARAR